MTLEAMKVQFVRELAKYLQEDAPIKSIRLEAERRGVGRFKDMEQWAALRATTPLFGYPSVENAEKQLADWLGICIHPEAKKEANGTEGTTERTT